uniref:Uncharacterized protein n=1 Tax=Anguilla anguilla TaxID=7936 RepID=A0A0E9T3Y9_ANGAN
MSFIIYQNNVQKSRNISYLKPL